MFGKRYMNALILDNAKDATLVAGMEGYGNVNYDMNDVYPVSLVIPTRRFYIQAVFRSLRYSKMGIFNAIIKT